MKVVIPLAGKGTRLRPHTHVTPKPLLRVADKPVMSYILDDLRDLGVHEAVFVTGHLKEKVESYVREQYPEFRAHFVEQPVQNGTAGAVELAKPFIDEDVLILFVDTLFDADLSIVQHLPEDVAGVIWVKEVEDYQRFGVVVPDENGFMQRIVEKPSEPISKLANIGLYYIRDWKLLFEGIDHVMKSQPGPGGEYFLTDAFQYMIDHGAKLKTVEVEGWYDAGKPETLLETNEHLLSTGRSKRPPERPGVKVHDPVYVADGVELADAEIGPNVTISAGSVVRGSRLRDTIVGEKARLEDCDLRDSLIGNAAALRGVTGQVDVGDHSVVQAAGGKAG
ncbi:MAG TPA: sugar phosphate nucleotidyltransferase [Longimicrobiaceae bacterium]|nr:sugar phosphate nucleotidyltransferase [Longimicrobiaceae bacterium]